jgi:hypothetical protein
VKLRDDPVLGPQLEDLQRTLPPMADASGVRAERSPRPVGFGARTIQRLGDSSEWADA